MNLDREVRRDALFDLLAGTPDGLTVDDMGAALDCSHRQVRTSIHDLRLFLGDSDTINLPCEPQGSGERWMYRLVGDLDGTRRWMTNRLGDVDSRIRTMRGLAASIVNGTDGRTYDGRRSRLIERALRRLVEDLDDLLNTSP